MAMWTDYDGERDAQLALAELTGSRYYQRIEEEHQAEQGARRAAARSWEEVSAEHDREPEAEPPW
jgi:hypothetical protein